MDRHAAAGEVLAHGRLDLAVDERQRPIRQHGVAVLLELALDRLALLRRSCVVSARYTAAPSARRGPAASASQLPEQVAESWARSSSFSQKSRWASGPKISSSSRILAGVRIDP